MATSYYRLAGWRWTLEIDSGVMVPGLEQSNIMKLEYIPMSASSGHYFFTTLDDTLKFALWYYSRQNTIWEPSYGDNEYLHANYNMPFGYGDWVWDADNRIGYGIGDEYYLSSGDWPDYQTYPYLLFRRILTAYGLDRNGIPSRAYDVNHDTRDIFYGMLTPCAIMRYTIGTTATGLEQLPTWITGHTLHTGVDFDFGKSSRRWIPIESF